MGGSHKQIKFCWFKHYTVGLFEQELSKLNFPDYENYNDTKETYNEFIQIITGTIDKVVSIRKTGRTKLSGTV